ncbi:histone deacetylase 8-like [Pollicipes pollicipes]|uniref:histone deacetylase 8-like n=1 Tax=Pollicipes pollicipes TaxID=41117 RepID=UPI001884E4F6|nr:histone deacetylase 8-like [Pollicipes pollicipes]
MVHALLSAFGLIDAMVPLGCEVAQVDDLRNFHSSDYVDFLESVDKSKDLDQYEDDLDEYGLGFDCPLVTGILDLALHLAGGSLCAARALCRGEVDVAVNWNGGWHHAQRDAASGFCYVNDIVLAINELRGTFARVMYVDLDIHHGDGVENAFMYSSKVFTLSIHHYEDGYFPGTGSMDDVGYGRGRYFCFNVPLKEGATDDTFYTAFDR